MSFEILNKLMFVVSALLCATLLVFPDTIYWLFGVNGGASSDVFARRAAMLFAGLSVLVITTAETEIDELRQAVSISLAVSMAGLGILGLVELARGAVGAGILLAIAAEFTFAFFYLRFWRD